jgi:hypothetical protein
LGLRTLLNEAVTSPSRRSVQPFGSPAGGGGLGCMPLGFAEFGDRVG